MKRKKFVKQLMATGRDRNLARGMAAMCVIYRKPYADVMRRYKRTLQERPALWANDYLCEFFGGGGHD